MRLFSFGKLFCDLFLLVFFIVREKKGGKGRRGEDAWSVKYESIDLCCSQRTNNHHKFKCFQVKLKIYLQGLEAQAKPHKTQVQST